MEKIKFHLDESVERAIADGLRRREIDVTTTPEVELIGVSDEEMNFDILPTLLMQGQRGIL